VNHFPAATVWKFLKGPSNSSASLILYSGYEMSDLLNKLKKDVFLAHSQNLPINSDR
jgi:hypothetical protein